MKTKLFLLLTAAMLLMSVNMSAQPKKADDKKVARTEKEATHKKDPLKATKQYLYIGLTQPTEDNYQSIATEITSYNDHYEFTNTSSEKAHVYVLAAADISVQMQDGSGLGSLGIEEESSVNISGHKVYRTGGRIAAGGTICVDFGDEWKHYYLGTTEPTEDNIEDLTPSYKSFAEMNNITIQVSAGGKLYLLAPYSYSEPESFNKIIRNAFIDSEGNNVTFSSWSGYYKFRHTYVELIVEKETTITFRYPWEEPEPEGFSNNKLYTLTCRRGGLVLNADATGLAAGQTRTDAPESDKRFAIITYNNAQYLYSPVNKQYLLYDGSFVSRLGSPITFDDSHADGEYKFMLSTQNENGETWFFNNNGNIVINGWSFADDGNRWLIEPVADFDPTEALAMAAAQICTVTYQVKYESKVVATATVEVAKGSTLPAVPASLNNSFVTLTKSGTHPTTVTKDVTVNFTATWNGPFKFTKKLNDATWYYMHIRSGWYVSKQDTEPYYPAQAGETERFDPVYVWAFGGDPYHVKVYNYTTGLDETLTKDGENAVMRKGDYTWDLLPNSDGFVLRVTGTENSCINQYGGGGGPLKFWTDVNSLTDDGSTFRVEDVTSLIDGIETIHNSQFFIYDEGDTLFDLFGRKLSAPQKGVNIIRYSDGTTRKVLQK
ncbi:MAG: hypothetical protein IK144_10205 [Bacteroidaceae bacterium]|nr:hypothetical protein [Bacteroidaceae bacterium]